MPIKYKYLYGEPLGPQREATRQIPNEWRHHCKTLVQKNDTLIQLVYPSLAITGPSLFLSFLPLFILLIRFVIGFDNLLHQAMPYYILAIQFNVGDPMDMFQNTNGFG